MPHGVVVTRFAPSPTGHLHLGHAYSAWLNDTHARSAGGRFVLRIEDIDAQRCRPEYTDAALEDLAWLGINWGDGFLRQSERSDVYADRLHHLEARGLVYRCSATQAEVTQSLAAPHGPVKTFRSASLAAMEDRDHEAARHGFVWRLSLAAAAQQLGSDFDALQFVEASDERLETRPAQPGRFGDVIVGREDRGPTYHLASVIDDADQGVTHVIRGDELVEAAGLHVLLARLLDLEPPTYQHHRMITDHEGSRLSKRDNAESLRKLRAQGVSPEEVKARIEDA